MLVVEETGNRRQQRLQAHALPHRFDIGKADLPRRRSPHGSALLVVRCARTRALQRLDVARPRLHQQVLQGTAGVLLYVGYLLLPIQQWKKTPESFGLFDFIVALGMGTISFVTFGLDKAMLLGFWSYLIRNIMKTQEKKNYFLLMFSVILLISVLFQYLEAPK
jgi:hypothetical protein